jgi:hypothetical protein
MSKNVENYLFFSVMAPRKYSARLLCGTVLDESRSISGSRGILNLYISFDIVSVFNSQHGRETFLRSVQMGSRANSASYRMGTGGCFSWE